MKGLSLAEVSLYSHLVETLCFFVRQHAFRGKYFLLAENLPSRVAQLLESPEKHLKLTALKFFRVCVGLQDEFYIRHMIKNKLFEPILNIVIETMPRDNLLNSACLEFFEFIKRVSIYCIPLPSPRSRAFFDMWVADRILGCRKISSRLSFTWSRTTGIG